MNDIFAQIATERRQTRDARLVAPTPEAVPDFALPLDAVPGTHAFAPAPRISTHAELLAALAELRSRMAPFLANLAPELSQERLVLALDEFDWREETAADRRDAFGVLAGDGAWTKVTIPHYGPPLGRAVTYYRTSFEVTDAMFGKGSLWACFDAVDYKAHIFVNGAYLGSHEGFFAPFEFEFTACAALGTNTLLVKVENDHICMGSVGGVSGKRLDGDKLYAATGPGYDDPEGGWHHCPPAMGIYQGVRIEARQRLFIRDLYVRPLPAQARAEAWIEVYNCDLSDQMVAFDLSLFGQNFPATLFSDRRVIPTTTDIRGHGDLDKELRPVIAQPAGPGISQYRVSFDLPDARIWDLDTPWLYQLQVKLLDDAGIARDARSSQFGMREFRQDEQSTPKGKFTLNGREIRLRGANTMGFEQVSVMRRDWERLIDDILLARLCNMNFLRLTQRPVQREVYEYCDRLGLMTQTDLPLFGCLRRNQLVEAVRQAEEMERLVRPHACNIMISYINEPFPNGIGRPHRNLTRPELEDFFEMASRAVRMSNPERVIKYVDGDYDPPADGLPDNHCYCGWYIGHAIDLGRINRGDWLPIKPGWHFGCGEFGAEGLDSVGVMAKYYPTDWLPAPDQPPTEPWRPAKIHANQTNRFQYLWFPPQTTPASWVEASQTHQAWVTRLMTEAFRRSNGMNSFAIHLFIDAWPAGWMKTIMDVDRVPKKAYFAYRDALTPLMVSLRGDRRAWFSGETAELEAWVCNDTHEIPPRAQLCYQLEVSGRVVQSGTSPAAIPICGAQPQGFLRLPLPVVAERTRGIVRLRLCDDAGQTLFDCGQEVEIFPAATALTGYAFVLGAADGVAATLAQELGLACVFAGQPAAGDLILCDDPVALRRQQEAVARAVSAGATAVILELPVGSHSVAGDAVTVVPGGMGQRHYVDCGTGHPLVRDFQPYDCWFWHDASVGYPTPLLSTVLDPAPAGWTPILDSGNGSWATDWKPAPAAAEKQYGQGVFRICQVQLAHRTRTNPQAGVLARRLLGLA
ncbi:MAG: glycoside hydrolase family 2 [Anaerolineae bacterium]|nr:glycoside hydrolase family 2 [Anaerolineae bacterium]